MIPPYILRFSVVPSGSYFHLGKSVLQDSEGACLDHVGEMLDELLVGGPSLFPVRSSVPENMQANKLLLVKAMKAAHQSVSSLPGRRNPCEFLFTPPRKMSGMHAFEGFGSAIYVFFRYVPIPFWKQCGARKNASGSEKYRRSGRGGKRLGDSTAQSSNEPILVKIT